MTKILIYHAVVLAGALPLMANAQTVPDAGQLLNEQQRANPPAPRRPDPPAVRVPATPAAATAVDGLRVQLRSVRFSGATSLASTEALQARVRDSLGKTLDHAQLQQLAADITSWLRGQGFLLARAYLPRQDLTDGNLEIALVDGRLQRGAGRVVVQAETRIPAGRLAAIANAALPDAALHIDDLERAVLLINDLPGVSARSALEPGDASGTSKLVIEAREAGPYTGGATLDNFSNRSVGTTRGGAHLEWNDPLAIGDLLGVFGYATSGTESVGGFYSAPLTPSGLRLNVAASTLHYRVGGSLKPLDLNGRASTASVGVGFPLLRTRERNINLQLGYEHKALSDNGNGANLRRRSLDNLTTGISGNRFDAFAGGGVTEGALALTAGRVDLSGNDADRRLDAASARTDGGFAKASFHLSRVQSLGAAPSASAWSLAASFDAQLASGNLDTSEKFILGGPRGVRAYALGEAAGDEGVLATLELRRNLDFGQAGRVVGFAFIDSGRVRLHRDRWAGSVVGAGNTNDYGLTGVGFGVNASVGAWSLRSAVAHAVGGNAGRAPDGTDVEGRRTRTRVWLQASTGF